MPTGDFFCSVHGWSHCRCFVHSVSQQAYGSGSFGNGENLKELIELRERHENLKANEARIREHYLAVNAALLSTQDALRDALQQYGKHHWFCMHRTETGCTCGFSALLHALLPAQTNEPIR